MTPIPRPPEPRRTSVVGFVFGYLFGGRALTLLTAFLVAWPVMLIWPAVVDAIGAEATVDRLISYVDAWLITVLIGLLTDPDGVS